MMEWWNIEMLVINNLIIYLQKDINPNKQCPHFSSTHYSSFPTFQHSSYERSE